VLSWSIRPSLAEARRPPNYPYDDMPDTSFTCAGKVVGGYYADPDADCQMFHVCVQVDENDVSTYYQIDLRRYQKKRNGLFVVKSSRLSHRQQWSKHSPLVVNELWMRKMTSPTIKMKENQCLYYKVKEDIYT